MQAVVDYLNKEKGLELSADYHVKQIPLWNDWWKGFVKPFHEFTERSDKKLIKRKLYTLKMAKKVCEDWASILLNEKTLISFSDEPSSVFVQGNKETQGNSGILKENKFWRKGNRLIERAFATGTGAVVLRFKDMLVQGDTLVRSTDTKIQLEYLSAGNILPLTVEQDEITEVAFVSEITRKGKKYIYLETHELEESGYRVTNQYFREEEGTLKPEPLPDGMLETFSTGSDIPLFSIVSPNIENNVADCAGLGISVYANAIDNLEGTDLAYNNFNRDLKLGGKKVFMNRKLTAKDDQGHTVAPDDVMQQLFTQFGDADLKNDENTLIHEHNPSLRVTENRDAVQAQLDYLSFKCGLGAKYYQFNGTTVLTATQYSGDKQDLARNASKHYIAVEDFIQRLMRAILWAGKEILGQSVNPDADVTITFEDSFIIDKESERLRDLQEIRDGLMQKYEYRMKYRGEDEVTAKRMVGAEMTDDELMDFTTPKIPKLPPGGAIKGANQRQAGDA